MQTVEHWSKIDPDPTRVDIITWRKKRLRQARSSKTIGDRIKYFEDLCRGKRVLDVGVVEHTAEACTGDSWLHRRIVETAAYTLGVDILEAGIKRLSDEGYNVVCHDIIKQPLDEKFDVVLAGELIEHLGSPEGLFVSAASMLSPDGILVISTPYPWYINAVIKNMLSSEAFTDNVDHVAWYDPSTLTELAERSGLKLVQYTGIQSVSPNSLLGAAFFKLVRPLLRMVGVKPESFCKSIIYQFKRV